MNIFVNIFNIFTFIGFKPVDILFLFQDETDIKPECSNNVELKANPWRYESLVRHFKPNNL